MTKFQKLLPFLVLVFAAFTSCDKAEEIIDTLAESDAAEIIEANLQPQAGGLVSNLEDVAAELVAAVASGELCDSLYTETIEEDFQGARFQANYTSALTYEMVCNPLDLPQSATFSTLTATSYNSTRMVSDDNSEFTGSAVDLQPSSPSMRMDGNYRRTGAQVLNFGQQQDITSTLAIDLTTLEIRKQDLAIESGNGTILLTGTTPNEPFSFAGDIVFNGGNTATLTINGTTYELDWN